MAADWIKIESGLPNKPEVMQLADLLGVDELQVVGHLVVFWSWCDANMSLDCPVVQGTKKGLDRVAMRDGFVDAMVTVGWLEVLDVGRVQIPNYDHHLSKSAKTRANEQKKKAKQRKSVPKMSPPDRDKNGTREEKRREEKNISTHTHTQPIANQLGVVIPTEIAADWERWCNFRLSIDGRLPDPVSSQANLIELARRGWDKAKRDIDFSIRKNGKTILDSDNDFEKRSRSSAPQQRKQVGIKL